MNKKVLDNSDLYKPDYVRQLFDEMAATYGVVNFISSLGFSMHWRNRCVEKARLVPGCVVFDLMSGMGEMWPSIQAKTSSQGSLVAVELSSEMAKRSKLKDFAADVKVLETDVLKSGIQSASADVVVSGFGLKTFSDEQKQVLAQEIARILKPGGSFSLMEISVPPNQFLRLPYTIYVKYLIPFIGRIFLGNPHNYEMLWVYTERFTDASYMCDLLAQCGLQVKYERYFSSL